VTWSCPAWSGWACARTRARQRRRWWCVGGTPGWIPCGRGGRGTWHKQRRAVKVTRAASLHALLTHPRSNMCRCPRRRPPPQQAGRRGSHNSRRPPYSPPAARSRRPRSRTPTAACCAWTARCCWAAACPAAGRARSSCSMRWRPPAWCWTAGTPSCRWDSAAVVML